MIYVRQVNIEAALGHVGINLSEALPAGRPTGKPRWSVVTPVRDSAQGVVDGKFFASLSNECNDSSKRASLLAMLTHLGWAVLQDDYQSALKSTSVSPKEAFSFLYMKKTQRIWELKYQNKDRLYYVTHNGPSQSKLIVLLLYHHKKDNSTPKGIASYCEKIFKGFLDPGVTLTVLE